MIDSLTIVVSGAAGFVGSHMCDRLIAEGHRVIGLDNLVTGSQNNLRQLAGEPRFRFVCYDVTEPNQDCGTCGWRAAHGVAGESQGLPRASH